MTDLTKNERAELIASVKLNLGDAAMPWFLASLLLPHWWQLVVLFLATAVLNFLGRVAIVWWAIRMSRGAT